VKGCLQGSAAPSSRPAGTVVLGYAGVERITFSGDLARAHGREALPRVGDVATMPREVFR
jgi:hypothetical protein